MAAPSSNPWGSERGRGVAGRRGAACARRSRRGARGGACAVRVCRRARPAGAERSSRAGAAARSLGLRQSRLGDGAAPASGVDPSGRGAYRSLTELSEPLVRALLALRASGGALRASGGALRASGGALRASGGSLHALSTSAPHLRGREWTSHLATLRGLPPCSTPRRSCWGGGRCQCSSSRSRMAAKSLAGRRSEVSGILLPTRRKFPNDSDEILQKSRSSNR